MAGNESAGIKSLDNSFRIVETLREYGPETLTGLEERLDVPNSTIFDHVTTLEEQGYVVRGEGEYRLGLKLLEYGCEARRHFDFYDAAKPEIKKLASETGERVNLVTEENGVGVFLDIVVGDEAVSYDIHVGSRVGLHSTSAGKAILAFQPEERIDEMLADLQLPSRTSDTLTEPAALREELETVRSQGFALDLEERHRGLHCVGAPVKDADGVALGSVSISGPVTRMPEDRLRDDLAREVVQTANVIEINSMY